MHWKTANTHIGPHDCRVITKWHIAHLQLPGSLAQNQFARLFERAAALAIDGLPLVIFVQESPTLEAPELSVYPILSQDTVPVLTSHILKVACSYYGWSDQRAMWQSLKPDQHLSILEKTRLPDMIEADIEAAWIVRLDQRECVVVKYTENGPSYGENEDGYAVWEQYEG